MKTSWEKYEEVEISLFEDSIAKDVLKVWGAKKGH